MRKPFLIGLAVLALTLLPTGNDFVFGQAGSTPGIGYFWGLFIQPPVTTIAATAVGMANQVVAYQFVLPYSITVGHVTIQVNKGAASSTVNVGIYDSNGTLLVDSGAFDTVPGTTALSKALPSSVALSPGVYYFAQSASAPASDGLKLVTAPVAGEGMMNNVGAAVRVAIAASSASGGALPSTLGALTANKAQNAVLALFEP